MTKPIKKELHKCEKKEFPDPVNVFQVKVVWVYFSLMLRQRAERSGLTTVGQVSNGGRCQDWLHVG